MTFPNPNLAVAAILFYGLLLLVAVMLMAAYEAWRPLDDDEDWL